jgi:GNAT superfamily N-acetyltransferase
MKIRAATLEDESVIRTLYAAFAKEVVEFDHETPQIEKVWDKHIKTAIEAGHPVFVAVEDAEIVGLIAWIEAGTPESLLNLCVYVTPEFRREGIATKLMESARKQAIQNGCKTVFDTVSLLNEGAIELMKSLEIEPTAYAYNYTP